MPSRFAHEWSAQWPLPVIAVALLGVFFALRVALPATERGRVKAGIFFAGAYLVSLLAMGVFHPPVPSAAHHDWLRVLSVLLFSFASSSSRGWCCSTWSSAGARSRASCAI